MAMDTMGYDQGVANPFVHLASYHHAYAYHTHGATDWITHMVVSAVVHSLVYGLVFKLMRQMTLPEVVVLVAVGLAGVYLWGRRRDRRTW